jgi:hypothetical protein
MAWRGTYKVMLAMVVMSGTALGQFVTPPPAQNPTPENDIPKVPAPAPAPPVTAQPVPVRAARPAKEPLPDVKFKEWELGSDGLALPLSEPLELASLRRNPLVTSDTMNKIEAYLPDRKRGMERVIIENLDLIERIDGGLFERSDFFKKEDVQRVVETTKPLQTASLAMELKNRQIIDDKAFGINSRITTAYSRASAAPAKEGEDQTKAAMKFRSTIYRHNFHEHLWTYNELLAASADAAKVDASLAKPQKIEAVKAALAKMGLEERKELLRGVSGYTKDAPKPDASPAAKPAEAPAAPAAK